MIVAYAFALRRDDRPAGPDGSGGYDDAELEPIAEPIS